MALESTGIEQSSRPTPGLFLCLEDDDIVAVRDGMRGGRDSSKPCSNDSNPTAKFLLSRNSRFSRRESGRAEQLVHYVCIERDVIDDEAWQF